MRITFIFVKIQKKKIVLIYTNSVVVAFKLWSKRLHHIMVLIQTLHYFEGYIMGRRLKIFFTVYVSFINIYLADLRKKNELRSKSNLVIFVEIKMAMAGMQDSVSNLRKFRTIFSRTNIP